jgi:branched-chain amino acid transport system substrate-binding protein
MVGYDRRTLLKGGAAFAGASALGFPAIVRAQAGKIKIGHLVPLTGFLGAIGGYARKKSTRPAASWASQST